jgi:hypothetical protein
MAQDLCFIFSLKRKQERVSRSLYDAGQWMKRKLGKVLRGLFNCVYVKYTNYVKNWLQLKTGFFQGAFMTILNWVLKLNVPIL